MVGAIDGFAVKSLFHHRGWIPREEDILIDNVGSCDSQRDRD